MTDNPTEPIHRYEPITEVELDEDGALVVNQLGISYTVEAQPVPGLPGWLGLLDEPMRQYVIENTDWGDTALGGDGS